MHVYILYYDIKKIENNWVSTISTVFKIGHLRIIMISVKNLFKTFNGFQAVSGLSFDIIPGNVVGFLGPNGAGKSTTMKMLTGFLLPTSGDIHITNLSLEKSALEIKKKIGYLPEGAPAYGDMTPLQFLNFIAQLQVHDELVFDVPKGEVEALTALVREHMEGAVELAVPLEVEVETGAHWLEAH